MREEKIKEEISELSMNSLFGLLSSSAGKVAHKKAFYSHDL